MSDQKNRANSVKYLKIVSTLLASTITLNACNSDVITPGSPDVTAEEYVYYARLAEQNDKRAIRTLLSSQTVLDNDQLYLKWADLLARTGSSYGYSEASSIRITIASNLEPGDPERLLLMSEALAFYRKASEINPDLYDTDDGIYREIENRVAEEKKIIDKIHGSLVRKN